MESLLVCEAPLVFDVHINLHVKTQVLAFHVVSTLDCILPRRNSMLHFIVRIQ